MKPKTDVVVQMMVPITSHAGAYLMQEASMESNYEDVNHAASIAVNSTSAGYGDVLIENIRIARRGG